MPGSVEYDGDAAAPKSRSKWLVAAGLAAVVLVVMTQGVVALLVFALAALLVGLVIGFGWSIVKAARGRVPESGDAPPPGFTPNGGPAAQRAEAGHASPSVSR